MDFACIQQRSHILALWIGQSIFDVRVHILSFAFIHEHTCFAVLNFMCACKGWNIGPCKIYNTRPRRRKMEDKGCAYCMLIFKRSWTLWNSTWLTLPAYSSKRLRKSLVKVYQIGLWSFPKLRLQSNLKKGWAVKVRNPIIIWCSCNWLYLH